MELRGFLRIIALVAPLLICGCDPILEYSPKQWSKSDERKFSNSFELLDVTITPLGGISGSQELLPELTIHNRANSPAVIENVVLKSNGTEYAGHPFGKKSWEPIPPNETVKNTLEWQLGKPIYQVLKDPVNLNITIKVGEQRTEISIPMSKTSG